MSINRTIELDTIDHLIKRRFQAIHSRLTGQINLNRTMQWMLPKNQSVIHRIQMYTNNAARQQSPLFGHCADKRLLEHITEHLQVTVCSSVQIFLGSDATTITTTPAKK